MAQDFFSATPCRHSNDLPDAYGFCHAGFDLTGM